MMPRTKTWVKNGAVLVSLAACMCGVLEDTRDEAAASTAGSPVGIWKLRCVSPDGKKRECIVSLVRKAAALDGDYTADGVTRPVKKVAFEEGVLSVEVEGRFAGQAYGLTYEGAPRGDAFQGSVRWSFGWASGSFPFDGERVEPQVVSSR
jgi:hypothetical protein